MTAAPPPCPACGAALPPDPRYPGRFCNDCLTGRATDHAGTPLTFVEDMRAAIGWQKAGDSGWTPAVTIRCLIAGQPATVHAARFGGIVALPADSTAMPRHGQQTDLTRPT
ncbi:MAG: hypothetical protein ACK4GW_15560 [Pseudorhodobacter sp.]